MGLSFLEMAMRKFRIEIENSFRQALKFYGKVHGIKEKVS